MWSAKCVFFGPKKMRFMQIESVLQTINRSEPAKNRFSVALDWNLISLINLLKDINKKLWFSYYSAMNLFTKCKSDGIIYEPAHDKTNKMTCVPSKDSDQSGHPLSLISLRCPHEDSLGPWLSLECTVKKLIRLGGCPDWSESSLGGQAILLVLSCCSSYLKTDWLLVSWTKMEVSSWKGYNRYSPPKYKANLVRGFSLFCQKIQLFKQCRP